ncbi:MAG: YHS domain-containing protein [Verrucomicrobiales bacterium]|jgi:YHS domain-containing protein
MTQSKPTSLAAITARIFALFAAVAVGLTLSSCETTTTGGHDHSAHDHGDHAGHNHSHASTTEKKAEPAAGEKLCPVSGEVIEKAYVIDYQGQEVEFCCKQCSKEFLANPTAYLGGDAS